jgi:putative DNA primase/helicase
MLEFIEFARQNGLILNSVTQGGIHRCPTLDHPLRRNGAYHFGGVWGWIQNHAEHQEIILWTDQKERTEEEKLAFMRQVERDKNQLAKERRANHQRAAQKASTILSECVHEPHAYLDSHGLKDLPGLVWHKTPEENLLIIPMMIDRRVVGLQMIDREGQKKFLFGQQSKGASYVIGQNGINVWCEGYCTGMAVHRALQAIKRPAVVHICFSAANMQAMALRSTRGIVVADNDSSGTGQKAALATGLPYYLPETEGQDACDEFMELGLFTFSQKLQKFLLDNRKTLR